MGNDYIKIALETLIEPTEGAVCLLNRYVIITPDEEVMFGNLYTESNGTKNYRNICASAHEDALIRYRDLNFPEYSIIFVPELYIPQQYQNYYA